MSHSHYFYRTLSVKNSTNDVDSVKKLSVASEDRRFLGKPKNAHKYPRTMWIGPGIQHFELREAIQIAQHIEDIAADLLRSLRSVPGLWLDRDTGAKALFN